MNEYIVNLTWSVTGSVKVKANSPEEAAELAKGPTVSLPESNYYLEDSITCNPDADVRLIS